MNEDTINTRRKKKTTESDVVYSKVIKMLKEENLVSGKYINFFSKASIQEIAIILVPVLCTIAVIWSLLRVYIQSKRKEWKRDWDVNRCKPWMMPLAGFLEDDYSFNDFTKASEDNLSYCLRGTFASMLDEESFGFKNVFEIMQSSIGVIGMVAGTTRGLFDNLLLTMKEKFVELKKRLRNMTLYMQILMMGIKDSIKKFEGVITTLLFAIYTLFLWFKNFFRAIYNFMRDLTQALLKLVTRLFFAGIFVPLLWSLAGLIVVPAGLITGMTVLMHGFIERILLMKAKPPVEIDPDKIKDKALDKLKVFNEAAKALKNVGKAVSNTTKKAGKAVKNIKKKFKF